MTDFSLPKDKFDAIVLLQVLEHLPYPESEQALKKLGIATPEIFGDFDSLLHPILGT